MKQSTRQARRGRSGKASRSSAGDVNGAARANPSGHGAVVAGRQDVGQTGHGSFHGLVAVWQGGCRN